VVVLVSAVFAALFSWAQAHPRIPEPLHLRRPAARDGKPVYTSATLIVLLPP